MIIFRHKVFQIQSELPWQNICGVGYNVEVSPLKDADAKLKGCKKQDKMGMKKLRCHAATEHVHAFESTRECPCKPCTPNSVRLAVTCWSMLSCNVIVFVYRCSELPVICLRPSTTNLPVENIILGIVLSTCLSRSFCENQKILSTLS